MRRNVVAEIARVAGSIPVKHITTSDASVLERNVLVVANETVVSPELLGRIRERAAQGPASFLIIAPQSDELPSPEAERRLRRALSELRSEGIDIHGQVVHPDPYTAVLEVANDERVDEVIVSTFPQERSGWLRRDLIERLERDVKLPIEHVVSA
jgi:nucleotide-binding universal stress UspA family protein